MRDTQLDDNSPLDREGRALSYALLELRHLLETGRIDVRETRQRMKELVNIPSVYQWRLSRE